MNNLMRTRSFEVVESQPTSLHDDLLSQLRNYIVAGDLAPGARIPERELCEKFEVSRTPLREALKVLAAEGLIELLANRGARVRVFSEGDIRNLFEVIAGLDFVAGRLACERITDEGIANIERLHLDMYTCYMRRELADYFRLNQQIHQEIVDAAGNPVLSANYASANAVVRRLRFAANLVHRDRLSDAMREHEDIVDALRRRAGQELGLKMYEHMQRKCDAVCEYMREQAQADSKAAPDLQPAD
ncbi:MAG: GntR family transcriptional regulator [Proteobacteria bacterium SG_bin9]|nr:MAG: GntR family transcriptional regulator [Proteobacteria bacterium SG_bin9]